MSPASPATIRALLGSVERRGRWQVGETLEVRALWGNVVLDLREVELPETLTIDVHIRMANVELVVPPEVTVELVADSHAASVTDTGPSQAGERRHVVRITGSVRLGNLEVIRLGPGETVDDLAHRERVARVRARHRRWQEWHAEREMWRDRRHGRGWVPWWLMARMRRRIFLWLALALAGGIAIGHRVATSEATTPWWWIAIGLVVLSLASGAISWRLTRPLLVMVRVARDIGDGKLDTRLAVDRHGGEMRVLAAAINDMAAKIQQQLADQRQLLAAVSHELRTPLGHMRVLLETAREASAGDRADDRTPALLAEVEREILVLDDLVGRLLASSRLEFGNLDRRPLDLGELVSDAATSAGVAPEQLEASGEVRVAADPTLVRRAVANLIDNAKLHGGGVVAIRIERRAGQVAIEVDDAGPGVPAERRADAFRAFVPSSGGGLGLGLALVSRIAVAHGGGAWIADRPGGGARVGFTIASPTDVGRAAAP
jgi:two-component system, OmpR family, sensor kinase